MNTTISNSDRYSSVTVPVAILAAPVVGDVMKGAAADRPPYEFFRWKSSCGRLAVRTTWVKGVRHVILSDDDVTDERPPSEKEKRPRLQHKNSGSSRPPLSVVSANNNNNNNKNNNNNNNDNDNNNDDDDSYVERVLQWLHKPSGGVLETCQKPMSAPGNGGGVRRPALIKTFSIPENKFAHQQVAGATRRPTTCTKSSSGGRAKNHQKTELHVHMPSTCPA